MDKIFRKETYVVNLRTDTNKALPGKNELILTVNNQAIEPVILDYSDYEQDVDGPAIVGSVKKEGKNSITFSLEDVNGVNRQDASEQTHYNIQMDGGDKEGEVFTIDQVNVNENAENVSITLTVKEAEFYNGDYTLTDRKSVV